jgi:homoserine kinase
MMEEVKVRIPATSANLGPGFDCLGVALDCHNVVTVARSGPAPPSAMVEAAGQAFFASARTESFAFSWQISGRIPRSRGLGSSVSVRLGILHGLNELSGRPLDRLTLYRLCAELEGHPDNAAPAAFGGFAAARADSVFFRCEVAPALHFVVLIPDHEIETEASRGRLPVGISHADAARNTAHASLITAAFASGQYKLLRGSLRDWLHEPYREAANPHLRPAVTAGVAAGALGGYLSGSGSAVACLTLENPGAVAAAMQAIVPSASVHVLVADNTGATVLS